MKNFYFTCFAILAFAVSAFAQQQVMQTDTSANGTITYRRYNASVTPKPVAKAKELLKATLQMRPDDSLHLDTIVRQEKLKLSHWAYQQYYKGIQVLYGTYVVHVKNGIIETINGNFIKVGSPSVKDVCGNNLSGAIKITDVLGKLRKSFEYQTGIQSIKISVADLNPGIYSLSVFDGQQWQSQNVIVQK